MELTLLEVRFINRMGSFARTHLLARNIFYRGYCVDVRLHGKILSAETIQLLEVLTEGSWLRYGTG
jgi:hypothetical protein